MSQLVEDGQNVSLSVEVSSPKGNIITEPDLDDLKDMLDVLEAQEEDEVDYLSRFLSRYLDVYDFSEVPQFGEVLMILARERLLSEEWRRLATRKHFFRVLQSLRVLTRDEELLRMLFSVQGVVVELAALFNKMTEVYWDNTEELHDEIMIELCSILKRLAQQDYCQEELFQLDVHRDLLRLLQCKHSYLLQAVLVALTNLSTSPLFLPKFAHLQCIEPLISILSDYDVAFKYLACELLNPLLSDPKICEDVRRNNRLALYFIEMCDRDQDPHLLYSVLNCLNTMAQDSGLRTYIRSIHGIERLVDMLLKDVSPQIACRVCAVLTTASIDDEIALLICRNGLYALGKLFCERESGGGGDGVTVQLHAIRSLRYLYSLNRNREAFRRLFKDRSLFTAFHDVGDYVMELEKYEIVVEIFNNMPWPKRMGIIAGVHKLHEPDEQRMVREYILVEDIGQGAFGTVYKVRCCFIFTISFPFFLFPFFFS